MNKKEKQIKRIVCEDYFHLKLKEFTETWDNYVEDRKIPKENLKKEWDNTLSSIMARGSAIDPSVKSIEWLHEGENIRFNVNYNDEG